MSRIHHRIEALEGRIPAPEQQASHSTEAGRKLLSWLDGYSTRKRAGTLTVQDEAEADEIWEAIKRRRQELDRGVGS